MLRYTITTQGILDSPWQAPTPAEKEQHTARGNALTAMLDAEDEDDWDADTPDVSGDFTRLQNSDFAEDDLSIPLTADFAHNSDGTLTLLRWPRLARPAIVPDCVEGQPVVAIAATAFAAAHLPEARFAEMFTSPISYSVFSIRMGRFCDCEPLDEGGPTSVVLPQSIAHIGPYAFWRCTNLEKIVLPDGITELPVGVFGECARLEAVHLPAALQHIGYLPRPTDQVMPDVGVFAGCHALRELTLPAALQSLGAHSFNSSGLVHLTALDLPGYDWSRPVTVAASAFDHSAALLWLDKACMAADGSAVNIEYRLGLPVARDKILAGDHRFGAILRVPLDFFTQPPAFFDEMAQQAFRLDFSARMALARLPHSGGLTPTARRWYVALLVQHFDSATTFMPNTASAYNELFALLETCPELTATDMSALLRTAGLLGLPAELVSHMMEVRTRRFSSMTGFEDLDLD